MPKKATAKTTAPKTVAKKAATKTAVKKVAAKKAVATKTAVKKVAAKKVPTKKVAPKKVAKKSPITTTVIAKVDAGFGNTVSIRGNSSGLTWDSGSAMKNVNADEWVWQSTSVTSELEFKVLINDEIWSTGNNGVVFPGATVVFEPNF